MLGRSLRVLAFLFCSASMGCGSGSDSEAGDAGGPDTGSDAAVALPNDCPDDALSISREGAGVESISGVASSGYPGVFQIGSPTAQGHTVTFYIASPSVGTLTFPDSAADFDYKEDAGTTHWVASSDRVGGSSLVGTPGGTLTLVHAGADTGQPVCGSFDVTLDWTDSSDFSVHATGEFGLVLDKTPER